VILLKPVEHELNYLVDWAVNSYGEILYYLEKGWLQLEDYELYKTKMRNIHYDCYHGHCSDEIRVSFNHCSDNKIHFEIPGKFKGERICTYDSFSKRVWDYLKGNQICCEQLTLSLFYN